MTEPTKVTTETEDTFLLLAVRDAICDALKAIGLEEDGREIAMEIDEAGCGFHIGERAIEVMITIGPVEDGEDDLEDEDDEDDEDLEEPEEEKP